VAVRSEVVRASPWAAPRKRAETLRATHGFVAELFSLYLALLEVWEEAWAAARADQPADLAGWTARRVLPMVVAATAEHGPQPLVRSLRPVADPHAAEQLMAAWLAGEDLVPVERYLARASLRGPLEALDAAVACAADPAPRGERRCPSCGGPPQLSFRTDTGEALVSGHRKLECARCGQSWSFAGSTCAYCGETAGNKRTVYTERHEGARVGRGTDAGDLRFPHVRVEACTTCRRYLVDVDLGRDPRAVPEVDELAALPLDLYVSEQGFSKITPNVMGF
jgi:FdhE protein